MVCLPILEGSDDARVTAEHGLLQAYAAVLIKLPTAAQPCLAGCFGQPAGHLQVASRQSIGQQILGCTACGNAMPPDNHIVFPAATGP